MGAEFSFYDLCALVLHQLQAIGAICLSLCANFHCLQWTKNIREYTGPNRSSRSSVQSCTFCGCDNADEASTAESRNVQT